MSTINTIHTWCFPRFSVVSFLCFITVISMLLSISPSPAFIKPENYPHYYAPQLGVPSGDLNVPASGSIGSQGPNPAPIAKIIRIESRPRREARFFQQEPSSDDTTSFSEIGYIQSTTDLKVRMRLFRRRKFPRVDRFEHHVIDENGIKIALTPPTDKELMENNTVSLPGSKEVFTVHTYVLESPRFQAFV